VVAEGVSAFPQEVTGQMLHNFVSGGAAISVLARQLGACLEVVDLGTVTPALNLPGVRHLNIGPGTANFVQGPAMTQAQGVLCRPVATACCARSRRRAAVHRWRNGHWQHHGGQRPGVRLAGVPGRASDRAGHRFECRRRQP
jgi:hypothetical protein